MREVMQGRQPETTAEELEPRAVGCLTTVAAPNQQHPERMEREMVTLSHVVDAIARCQPHAAADLACQKIKSLDHAHLIGEWRSSEFMEILPNDGRTLMSQGEREIMARNERSEARLRGADLRFE
jgi:hypothetical protein